MPGPRSFHGDSFKPPPDPVGVMGRLVPTYGQAPFYELQFPELQPIRRVGAGCSEVWRHGSYGPVYGIIDGKEHRFKALYQPPSPFSKRNTPYLIGILDERLSVTSDGQVLFENRPGRVEMEGARTELWLEGRKVWTMRDAWRDSETRDGAFALIWVEAPEDWGEDLPWLLFVAVMWPCFSPRDNMPDEKMMRFGK